MEKPTSDNNVGNRRDEALRRALQMPPKPHKPLKADECQPLSDGDYFLVVGDNLRIAHEKHRDPENGSITADLYRNLEEYRRGQAMERDIVYWL